MNAKKVKAIRKLLRNLVATHNEEIPEHEFVDVRNTTKDIFVEKAKEDGSMGVEKVRVFDGQKRASPKSQRGVYLHLKKEMEKV